MLIPLGATIPTIVPSVAATPSMPVTIASLIQEALAAVLDTPAMVGQELSVPETILSVTTANNISQLGGSYLNNCIHQVIPSNNVSLCSSGSFAQETLI